MPAYQNIKVPSAGEKITVDGSNNLVVPNSPIIPYVEGDGIGAATLRHKQNQAIGRMLSTYLSHHQIQK